MLAFAAAGIGRKRAPRRAIVLSTVLLFSASAIAGFFQLNHLERLRAMHSWPTVSGKVIESRTAGKKAIVPYVVYSFDVGDQPYTGTSDLGTPAFGNSAKRLNEAETLLAEYPIGKDVTVHYDPADPHHSFIVSAVPWNAYMQMGLWLFLSLASAGVFVFFAYDRKRRSTLSASLSSSQDR